jgi:hypothetical protein
MNSLCIEMLCFIKLILKNTSSQMLNNEQKVQVCDATKPIVAL